MSGEQAAPEQKAVYKKPEAFCDCMKWMIENKIMRLGESVTGFHFIPVIENGRGRKSEFVPVKFCPNCGTENFEVVTAETVTR